MSVVAKKVNKMPLKIKITYGKSLKTHCTFLSSFKIQHFIYYARDNCVIM